MIALAKEYGEVIENEINKIKEPRYVANVLDDCIESNYPFLNKLVKLQNLLIVADDTKRIQIDNFINSFVDGVSAMVFPQQIFCLDLRKHSVFQSAHSCVSTIISNTEDCFKFLEEDAYDDTFQDEDLYIIIDECFDLFFENCDKFVKIINKLFENPKNHIICISTEPTLLTEELVNCFSCRCAMWVGSTRASKLLFNGKNVGCNPLMDGECIFSEDYGESYTNEFIDEMYSDDNVLDI